MLDRLVESMPTMCLLLLVNYRPEYQHGWGSKTYYTQLRLDPLPPASADEFLHVLLGDDPSLVPLKQLLIARTEGNPFFLEESVRTLVETGVLVGEPGAYRLAQALPTIQVPATVLAVLAARIDRLPPEEKRLLQTAAVVGTEVPLPLLQAIAEMPEAALHRGLAHLQAAEFLYETHLFPEPEYTFKHALTHEVAYNSLLLERRRMLHARVVEALEALAPERVAEQVERLAHHALRGEVWDKAVPYCQQAGARAYDRAAFREAVAAFEQALQALEHLPEDGDTRGRAIEIRLAVERPLNSLGELGRCLVLLGEAEARARALDDRTRLGRVLVGMAGVLRITGDYDGAMAAGQQALALAAALGDSALQVQASSSLGSVYYAIGDFAWAAELRRRNVEAADRESGTPTTPLRSSSWAWLARTLSALGAFAEGRRHGEEALRRATLEGRGSTPIIAHAFLGELYLAQGELEHAIQVLEQGLALCRAFGNRTELRGTAAALGYASALQGRLAEGRALLEEALSESIRTGALRGQTHRVAWLSEVCRLAGRGEEAWQHARQALDLARQQKARVSEAHALHQLGAVHAHADSPDAAPAEAYYQQALALAQALGMRPLQAHCHFGLGRLYGQIGRVEQARAALTTAIALYRTMDMTFRSYSMIHKPQHRMTSLTRRRLLQGTLNGMAGLAAWHQGWPRLRTAAAQKREPSGQMTWAVHIQIAPTWFDPAETPGIITPFMFMYAMHDALLKPMPDNPMAPSLATKWQESPDGLTYDFELRQGVKFHNGDAFTAADVKFSFERYKGSGASDLKKKIKAVEMVNPHHVRFQLQEPWPDFLTFYATPATGVGWIVPKNYTEKIGSEKFKDQPVGLGPYRFVNYQPGVELVLEANPDYWRKVPSVKRLVMKSVPEATTRLAMLKKQEVDVAYALFGALGEEVRRDPNLKIEPVVPPTTQWVVFTSQQYDPKSPWYDRRVRLAANHAINRQAINEAETLGYSIPTGSIIPRKFDGALVLEPYPYDPKKARQLLQEAGYANGFEAGDCTVDIAFTGLGEAIVNDLVAVGIRAKMRPVERAADQAAHREKSHKTLALQGSGAFGSAATRLDAFVTSTGSQSWIKDPEIDAWYAQQARERDRQQRVALLHRIQQKLYDEVRFLPIWDLGGLHASGPRVAVSGVGLIPLFAFSGPLEDVQLKP